MPAGAKPQGVKVVGQPHLVEGEASQGAVENEDASQAAAGNQDRATKRRSLSLSQPKAGSSQRVADPEEDQQLKSSIRDQEQTLLAGKDRQGEEEEEEDSRLADDDTTRNLPGASQRTPATAETPKGLKSELSTSKVNQTMLFQGVQLQKILDNSLQIRQLIESLTPALNMYSDEAVQRAEVGLQSAGQEHYQ